MPKRDREPTNVCIVQFKTTNLRAVPDADKTSNGKISSKKATEFFHSKGQESHQVLAKAAAHERTVKSYRQ